MPKRLQRTWSCSQTTDIDECETSNGGCAHNCINLEGSYECSCREGFELSGDNRTCGDVDECSATPCSHTCTNLDGGFRCECPEGYILDIDRRTCNGVSTVHAVTPYSDYSHAIRADVDECVSANGGCAHNCVNLEGSHACSCREGFELESDGRTCGDSDECSANPCSHTCVNLDGGFRCDCPRGYILDEDRLSCIGKFP